MAKNRSVKLHAAPNDAKQVRTQKEPSSFWDMTPLWSLSCIDLDDGCEWCFGAMDQADMSSVFARLKEFERMTWREIETQTKHHNHPMPVKIITQAAQNRLAALNQDDVEDLFTFRIEKKQRVWGIRRERIYHILWWDPEHTVYPIDIKK
jgi:hypothetical protein